MVIKSQKHNWIKENFHSILVLNQFFPLKVIISLSWNKLEICYKRQVVWGKSKIWQTVFSEFIFGDGVEDGLNLESVLRVEDVVEDLLTLLLSADLPAGVVHLPVPVGLAVGRRQPEIIMPLQSIKSISIDFKYWNNILTLDLK